MHRTLKIDEIIRMILQYLRKSDRHNLASVCTSFLEPALDALWHTLEDGPDPLYLLLPGAEESFASTEEGERDIVVSNGDVYGFPEDRWLFYRSSDDHC